jgi:hypothetical protein
MCGEQKWVLKLMQIDLMQVEYTINNLTQILGVWKGMRSMDLGANLFT